MNIGEAKEGLIRILNQTKIADQCGLSTNDFRTEIEIYETILAELDKQKKEWFDIYNERVGDILNLQNEIEDLKEKLDKQEKIINAMAEDMIDGELDIQPCCIFKKLNRENCYRDVYYDERACVGCIKQYYEKKVSEYNG